MQTTTEESPNQIAAELHHTSSVKSQLLDNFKGSKGYRHAFVEEKVRTQLALQIKTIREQREISRPEFADLLDKSPSWVFRLEDPNQSPPTISSLLKVAEAFDVDLEIRFRRFSELLDHIDRVHSEEFKVPSFDEELEANSFDRGALVQTMANAMFKALERYFAKNDARAKDEPLQESQARAEKKPPAPAVRTYDMGHEALAGKL